MAKFGARGNFMFCRLPFAVAFADLLFDFFGYPVNGRVKVSFAVLGKQVRAAHVQTNGTTELSFWDTSMIVFKGDARINNTLIVVIQFFQLAENMVFDGFGQCNVVRRKNQFHAFKMQSNSHKIQIFLEFWRDEANFVPISLSPGQTGLY